MGNFVKSTSVFRTANLSTRAPITPVLAVRLPGYIPDIPTAMAAYVAQGGTDPGVDLWGAFQLQWLPVDIRVYVVLGQPMVTRQGGMLAIDADIWESKAQFDAGDPPLLRETLERQQGESLAEVLDAFRDYLVRATVNGYGEDGRRDRRSPRDSVTTDPAFDTKNLLTRQQVIDLAGQVFDRP